MDRNRWVAAASAALLGVCGCVTDGASSANSTVDTFASQLPSSVQSSDASKPSSGTSAQSSESSGGTAHSSDHSSDNSSQTDSNASVPISSTVTLTSTTGAIGAVIWLAAKPAPHVAKAAQAFFRANQFQLEEDLALGAGRSIEDLAALAQIRREHLPEFAHLLHTHRSELLSLTKSDALTPERAVDALRRIGELIATSPALREDREAALARMASPANPG